MRATKYIVIGRHDCERNSYIPGGDIRHVVSHHHSLPAAARAADKAHEELGGCDGSDPLTQVMRRLESADSTPDETDDTYDYAGCQYIVVNVFDSHSIVPAPGGLGLKVVDA